MVFFANGIQTSPQCANSVNDPVITPVADTTEFNITATSVQGCTGEPINFDSSVIIHTSFLLIFMGLNMLTVVTNQCIWRSRCPMPFRSARVKPRVPVHNVLVWHTSDGLNCRLDYFVFRFIRTQGNNNQTGAKVVFCSPTILALQATVTVDLNTGLYTEVINQDVHVIQNLTDNALSGHAYNG